MITHAWNEFTIYPLTFAGRELRINYSTSAVGNVLVEIQYAGGRPQAGFTLADWPEKFGDEIEGVMS